MTVLDRTRLTGRFPLSFPGFRLARSGLCGTSTNVMFSQNLMQYGFEEAAVIGLSSGQLRFELIT